MNSQGPSPSPSSETRTVIIPSLSVFVYSSLLYSLMLGRIIMTLDIEGDGEKTENDKAMDGQ